MFPSSWNIKAGVFKSLRFQERVFKKIRFRDGTVWTVGLTVRRNKVAVWMGSETLAVLNIHQQIELEKTGNNMSEWNIYFWEKVQDYKDVH